MSMSAGRQTQLRMQEQKEVERIKEKLFTGIDNDYNVTNQANVNEVFSELEIFPISRESLETSQLGKHINEIRRRSTDRDFAARAKALIKKWRTFIDAEQKEQQQREQQQQQHAQLQSTTNNQQQAAQQQQHGLASNDRASNSGLPAGCSNVSKADASYSASSRVLKSNNHIPSVPNSRLPLTTSSCQPSMGAVSAGVGSRYRNTGHSDISSLSSSASTSPGLSCPTTPSHLINADATVSPAMPAVFKTNAANKCLRKDALEANDPAEDYKDANQGPSNHPHLNNPNVSNTQQDFLHDLDTRDSFNSQTSSGIEAGPSLFGATQLPNASGASNSCDNNLDQSAGMSQDASINGNDSIAGNSRFTPHTTKQTRSSRCRTRRGATLAPEEGISSLEQQVQSVRKSSGRKRTTQEIVEGLAQRSNLPTVNAEATLTAPQAQQESKIELMNRLESQAPESSDNMTSPPLSHVPLPDTTSITTNQSNSLAPSGSQSHGRLSGTTTPANPLPPSILQQPANPPSPPILQQPDPVDELMAQLPFVSLSQVKEELEEENIQRHNPAHLPKTKEELVKQLHVDFVENFNGNFDHSGGFKEWNEVVTKETDGGDLLLVLPYSNIE